MNINDEYDDNNEIDIYNNIEYIKYKFREIEYRLDKIEKHLLQISSILGMFVAKTISISTELDKQKIINNQEIDDKIDSLISIFRDRY